MISIIKMIDMIDMIGLLTFQGPNEMQKEKER